MNIKEFANKLNGRQYGSEITEEEEQLAKELGFVVIFGYSDEKFNKFIKFISKSKEGTYIYPGVLMRKFDISAFDTYEILAFLENENFLEKNYEIYCHKCDKYEFGIYEHYNDIPEELYCAGCDEPMKRSENFIVIFKVIADEY